MVSKNTISLSKGIRGLTCFYLPSFLITCKHLGVKQTKKHMETVVKQKVKFSIDVEVELEINLERVKNNYNIHNEGMGLSEEFDVHYRFGADINQAVNKFTEEVVVNLEIDGATGFKVITRQVEDVYNVHTRF